MVPTLPLRFNSTGAAQRKAPMPRKARDYFFRLTPYIPFLSWLASRG